MRMIPDICQHLQTFDHYVDKFFIPALITAQTMKFSIKYFYSKCDQIRSFLWIWSHLLKKSLMENFIFCAGYWWTYIQQHRKETVIVTCETRRYRIVIFADIAKTEYQTLRNITQSLTKLDLEQFTEYTINREELAKLKK